MTRTAILATIDPGESTGWGLTALHDGPDEGCQTHPTLSGQYLGHIAHGTWDWTSTPYGLKGLLESGARRATEQGVPLVVVVERFVISKTAMQKNTTWSSEVIGMVRLLCAVTYPGAQLDITQRPDAMKPLIQQHNKVLQDMGWKPRGSKLTTHEYDALSHAALFAARVGTGLTSVH